MKSDRRSAEVSINYCADYEYICSKPLKKNVIYCDTKHLQVYWNGENYYFNKTAENCIDTLGEIYVQEGLNADDLDPDDPDNIIITRITKTNE